VAAATACLLAGLLANSAVNACTTFCMASGDAVLFGRNYDFDFGGGALLTNPRGLHKAGFAKDGPTWTARHGSVTFNQFGRGFPMGGINEAGLVVELMWHDKAAYPAADTRGALGVLEWIQYQLDTASTVDDVIESDGRVRISGQPPLHYLVADRSGRAATIEFLGGRLLAHTDDRLPVSVLANDSYAESLAFWRGRNGRRASGSGSHERFARAADALSGVKSGQPASVDRAFAVLLDVAQKSTRWSIVYDQKQRVVHFRTDQHNPIRNVRLDGLDFTCGQPVKGIDVHEKVAGDITAALADFSEARNSDLVAKSYADFSGTRRTPKEEIDRVAAHPWRAGCGS
jgi:choloylglycine hydrolase